MMREKAEERAKAKAAAEAGGEPQSRLSNGGKIAKVLAKEEARIETGSQVAGAQLSFED